MIDKTFRRFPRASARFATVAFCAFVSTGTAGWAAGTEQTTAQDTQPQATTALYRDWQLRCVTAQSGGKACEQVGAVPTPDGKGIAARVVIGQPDKTKPAQMIVQLAPGVWLPDGVSLTVPGATSPVKAEFKQCLQVCFAQAELDEAVLSAMKAADQPATLGFTDAQRQGVSLPLSLNGFTAALTAAE
ncbi:MAG: invasion associated locus B family protein [Pseudodonghicola sp.]